MDKYRILTFDGGGVCGAFSAAVLVKLCKLIPNIVEKADLIAGSSIGALITLCIANGTSPKDLLKLYSKKNAGFVFADAHNGIFKPKYDNKNLKLMLQCIFPPDLRLKDLKARVLIPSFKTRGSNFINWGPVLFNNFPKSRTKNKSVIDVALASTAAPVYFPSYKNYMDGGIYANNPGLAAITVALDKDLGNQKLANIHLLSIGTGIFPYKTLPTTASWGIYQWTFYQPAPFPLLKVMIKGKGDIESYFISEVLGKKQFLRINPVLGKPIALDDYREIPDLINFGQGLELSQEMEWIKTNWL
ncbi:MAG: patatin-like phospholipase family protein [Bacillota bacterium]